MSGHEWKVGDTAFYAFIKESPERKPVVADAVVTVVHVGRAAEYLDIQESSGLRTVATTRRDICEPSSDDALRSLVRRLGDLLVQTECDIEAVRSILPEPQGVKSWR